MIIITDEQIEETLDHQSLIDALESAFRQGYEMPNRHHHYYQTAQKQENTLLIMPAWTDEYLGIKQLVAAPANGKIGKPTIQGIYTLFDTCTGEPVAVMDAAGLTAMRTACASALAAKYLAPRDPQTLLVVGGGKVARELITAHLAVRNYKEILVWMRRPEAFTAFKHGLHPLAIQVTLAGNLEEAVRRADVISCATPAETPLISGEWLQEGQHVDLIGSFRMNMREVDDGAIVKSTLFVDSRYGAFHESGELGIPAQNGLIKQEDVLADIGELCRGRHAGRTSQKEITLFKSVGIAIEDLTAAILVYQRVTNKVHLRTRF